MRLLRNITLQTMLLLGGILLVVVFAAPSFHVRGAASIAQGFQTLDKNISIGALVSFEAGKPNTVELSNTQRVTRLTGIVAKRSLLELSDGSSTVQVVTSGQTLGLVSDINGEVRVGDHITASPMSGIGMKATENVIAVGTAQGDLRGSEVTQQSVTNISGETKKINIGLIPIQVDVAAFVLNGGSQSYGIPLFAQGAANIIAGHEVSPVRTVVAIVILLLVFATVIVMLRSAIRSSIISIGRNPLSENILRRSLLEVSLTVVGVIFLGLISIYLILKL